MIFHLFCASVPFLLNMAEIILLITDKLGQEKQKLTPEEEKKPLEYQGQIENELNKAESSEGNMEQTSLRHIGFDNFNWKYFHQAQGVKSDEK